MFEAKKTETSFSVMMSATLENIDKADDSMAEFLDSLDISIDKFGLRIILRESVLNAVTHGSHEDPEKTVNLNLEVEYGGVSMTVSDQGDGFDVCEAIETPGPLSESGRGLALMKMYSDEMDYNAKGTVVILRKSFKQAEPATT